jgi:Fic family protein
MNKTKPYTPPFTITSAIVTLVAQVSEAVGRLSVVEAESGTLLLRRINRIRTIQGSLAIEGNTLSLEQITAILDGKRVIAPPREIQEVRNAIVAYERLEKWQPSSEVDLLAAHAAIMSGLLDQPGQYRRGGVGVMAGQDVVHLAPPAQRVPLLMHDLLCWLENCGEHPLIASSVFHYEFEFIHPFADGNGRLGRLWQSLILSRWNSRFAHIPVESLVYEHQQEYYQALQKSTDQSDSAPFIEFMLQMILNAASGAQSRAQTGAQSDELLTALGTKPLSANELVELLNLRSKTGSFKRSIKYLLAAGNIEYTIPDKPNSRLQKYRLTDKGQALLKLETP